MNNKQKSKTIWVGVNKNGKISIHSKEPKRDYITNSWVSDSPFLNYVLYESFKNMIEKTDMNWQSSPEPFEINF